MRIFIGNTLLSVIFLVLLRDAKSDVLNVPEEFSTIQNALNASLMGDTVRVSPGVYHEFLICSTDSIFISGWYSVDTLTELRTILDPIPGGLDTPSTMVLTGNAAKLQNLAFFNRPELREPVWPTRTGGVLHTGESLSLQYCRFDSISNAVNAEHFIRADHCTFVGCQWHCLFPSNEGTAHAENCTFDGSKRWLVYGGSGSRILNCSFRSHDAPTTYLLRLHGNDVYVRECQFTSVDGVFSLVLVSPQGNFRIEECVFQNVTGARAMIEVPLDCSGAEVDTPIVIANNRFQDYEGSELGGTTAIAMGCQNPNPGYFGLVAGNTFEDGLATGGNIPGIAISGSATLMDNWFERLSPDATPDVIMLRSVQDSLLARNNSFLPPGLAAGSNGSYFDARLNWWGDSTGPFHASLNPGGLGSEVGNGVLFEPWLTQPPDSSDTTSAVNDHSEHSIPTDLSLHVFPNPFNPVTTLRFSLPAYGNVIVRVHDVLGREVESAEVGLLAAGEHTLKLNGTRWSSGVHFATVSTNYYSNTAKLLLLK